MHWNRNSFQIPAHSNPIFSQNLNIFKSNERNIWCKGFLLESLISATTAAAAITYLTIIRRNLNRRIRITLSAAGPTVTVATAATAGAISYVIIIRRNLNRRIKMIRIISSRSWYPYIKIIVYFL